MCLSHFMLKIEKKISIIEIFIFKSAIFNALPKILYNLNNLYKLIILEHYITILFDF